MVSTLLPSEVSIRFQLLSSSCQLLSSVRHHSPTSDAGEGWRAPKTLFFSFLCKGCMHVLSRSRESQSESGHANLTYIKSSKISNHCFLTKQTESLRVGSDSDVTGQGNKLEIGEQFESEAHPHMGRPVSLRETFLVLQALLMLTGLLGFPWGGRQNSNLWESLP